jgi:phage/plasmid-associated DNA primase
MPFSSPAILWNFDVLLFYILNKTFVFKKKVVKHSHFVAGNGKGVWKEAIKAAFGPYYGTMSTDAVVKTPGQRPASKGSPTHYLFALKGKRMVILDETDESQCVDAARFYPRAAGATSSPANSTPRTWSSH